MSRRMVLAALVAGAVVTTLTVPSAAVLPGVGVISKKNMEWVWNYPAAVGSDIEFFEAAQADGSLKRYAIVGSMGNGFNIIDITDPALPLPAGVFVDPGINWQGDIQINPKRKIAVLATQGAIGFTVSHGGSDGLAFVDISNVATPTLLGVVNGLDGAAHNSTIINDEIIYTTGAARMVDYSNPAQPQNLGIVKDAQKNVNMCGGHDITVDPNRPNIIYNACGGGTRTEIWDVTDARNPTFVSFISNPGMAVAHQADPNPESTLLFITDEQGGGLTNEFAPGGGVHVWDISGKYVAGASLQTPKKVGAWFAPFYRVNDPTQTQPWGNVTSHNMTFQAERNLLSIAWYTAGSWITDLGDPTNGTGPYTEYKGTSFGGPTTWGNTQGNILLEGAETWSTKWTRFDDPKYDRYVFTSDITRGFDVLRYTGGMPKKVARLTVDADATGGVISGTLDRYAVWTYQGRVNKPLAGKAVTVRVGAQSVQVTTGDDGSFSATLALGAGTHTAEVTWAGDPVYQAKTVTQTVTA